MSKDGSELEYSRMHTYISIRGRDIDDGKGAECMEGAGGAEVVVEVDSPEGRWEMGQQCMARVL